MRDSSFARPVTSLGGTFAPPASDLANSGIGVAAAPSGGKGLSLDPDGTLPDGLVDLSAIRGDAWSSYTPVWSGTAVAPAIGNGTITGRYAQIGKLVHASVVLTMGTTSTYGTGIYTISLPLTNRLDNIIGGSCLAFDSSAGLNYYGPPILIATNAYPSTPTNNAALYGPVTNYAAAVPFTWATSDVLSLNLYYESF